MLNFYGDKLSAIFPTTKLENHPLLAACDCPLNKSTITFNLWRSPLQTTYLKICHAMMTWTNWTCTWELHNFSHKDIIYIENPAGTGFKGIMPLLFPVQIILSWSSSNQTNCYRATWHPTWWKLFSLTRRKDKFRLLSHLGPLNLLRMRWLWRLLMLESVELTCT